MKQRNKKFLQRIMTLMLSIILVSSSVNVLAAFDSSGVHKEDSVTQPQGNANPAGASGGETKVGYDFPSN